MDLNVWERCIKKAAQGGFLNIIITNFYFVYSFQAPPSLIIRIVAEPLLPS